MKEKRLLFATVDCWSYGFTCVGLNCKHCRGTTLAVIPFSEILDNHWFHQSDYLFK